jgi:3-hydroxyisobutyrate dehydrogenase-like beta-hydroxyacid dehydrogenase
MQRMKVISTIGFGEAAQAFVGDSRWSGDTSTFDLKLLAPASRVLITENCENLDVRVRQSNAEATSNAEAILSLVTADQAHVAAAQTAAHICNGAMFFDMNSIAPDKKRANEVLIRSAGGRYIDVAIMAPVHPARLDVPLLISGPDAAEAAAHLSAMGFSNVRVVGQRTGDASAIKMVRSVMIKGMEALTAECLIAADAAGVTTEVLSSLGEDWAARADYNLDRMLIHGGRRAAEMEEVCVTLESLGINPTLTRGTVQCQRALGEIGRGAAPDTLDAKLALIRKDRKADAA